jgi:hypothetical protein
MREARDTRVSDSWPYVRELADRASARKRLTIPECAAEYWKFMGGTYTGHREKDRERRATLLRFATLPHYDETKCNSARN